MGDVAEADHGFRVTAQRVGVESVNDAVNAFAAPGGDNGANSWVTECRVQQARRQAAAGLGASADLGFVGLDDSGPDADPAVITGCKAARNRPLTRGQKLSNKALAAVRAPVEHGFAHLKNWRVLGKVRTDPKWATALVRALQVLTEREASR